MAQKDKLPPNPFDKKPDSDADRPPPMATAAPDSDTDSILDFGAVASVREGASGVIPLAELPDPQSSPSLVSWTEVIRQHRETSQASPGAPNDPVKIDSVSDKDLLKRIVAEEQKRAQSPIEMPNDRDTDKLGKIPIVLDEVTSRSGSSIQFGHNLGDGTGKPLSGSAIQFGVTDPPSDAGGAMPMAWLEEEEVLEALPVDEMDFADADIPMAEAIPFDEEDAESLQFADVVPEEGGSVAALLREAEQQSEDAIDIPLVFTEPDAQSSILDILVQDDFDQDGPNRAASDIVDFGAKPRRGAVAETSESSTEMPVVAMDSSTNMPVVADTEIEIAAFSDPEIEMGDEWAIPDSGIHKQTMEAIDLDDENPEGAVDLYAGGPFTHGISDSGSLKVDEEQITEAARKKMLIESSAIDLGSHPSAGSMFDIEPPSEKGSSATAPTDEEIDMSLPQGQESQSSMIRRGEVMIEEEAAALAAELNERKRLASLSDSIPETEEMPTMPATPPPRRRPQKVASDAFPEPIAEVDNEAFTEELPTRPVRGKKAEKAEKTEQPKKKKGGGLILGTIIGIILGGGGLFATYYFEAIPDPKTLLGEKPEAKGTDNGPPRPVVQAEKATPALARQQLETGNLAKALEIYAKCEEKETPEFLAGQGQAKWLAYLQKCAKDNKAPERENAEVTAALTDLKSAVTKWEADKSKNGPEAARAIVWQGLIEESLGDYAAAEKIYADGQMLFDEKLQAPIAAASNRLQVTRPAEGKPVGQIAPAHLFLAFTLLLADEPEGTPKDTEPAGQESGFLFWEAMLAAAKHDYVKAASMIPLVKTVHARQQVKMAGRGLNPLSDPREQMLPLCLDELQRYWKLSDELYKRPEAKMLVEQKKAAEGLAAVLAKVKESDDALTAIVEKLKPKKDQKTLDAIDDLLKGKMKAEDDLKAADLVVAAVTKQIKDAGIDDPKLDEGLKKLITDKTDADAKVKAVVKALDDAGAKDPDLAKSLATVITARDASETTLKGVRERLEKAKIVDPNANQAAIFKAVDDALTRGAVDAVVKLGQQVKDGETKIVKLEGDLDKTKKDTDAALKKSQQETADQKTAYEAKLADVRTPTQVVDIWLPALNDKDRMANPANALIDAELVLKNPASDAVAKAKAIAVKALSLRNQGKLAEARTAFDEAKKHPGFAKDQPWARDVARSSDQLDNPSAFVGVGQPIATAPTTQTQLEKVENGLKLFPAETFAQDHAKLMAQRSLIKLDGNDIDGAAMDADAAIKGGAGAEGDFALARVLEKQGKLLAAENAYRNVIKAQPEGSPLAKQSQLGLARVLLQRASQPAPAPAPPKGDVIQENRESIRTAMLLMTLLFAAPEVNEAEILEAIKLADKLIADKEFLGHIIKADALAKLKRYNAALQEYSTGIKALKVLPKEYDGVLDRILAIHPGLQNPDANLTLEPSLALKYYGMGLEFYREGRYDLAEKAFIDSIRSNNKDARYMYFLGLTRWQQGKFEPAIADFKAGALLEMVGKPTAKTVNSSLESIQGILRTTIEKYRP